MIEFQKLTIEGFGSIQAELVLSLNEPGITLVRGRNGVGKTTIWNALFWALYNATLKDVPGSKVATWEELRQPGFRGTRVQVELTVNGVPYLIARHLDFKGETLGRKGGSSLVIARDGVLTAEMSKPEQQKYINRLLGFDPQLFVNAVLFGQRMTRLIQASDADKRKVFEELFELDFIQMAKEKAKKQLDALKIEGVSLVAEIKTTNVQKEAVHARITERKLARERWAEERKSRIAELTESLRYDEQRRDDLNKQVAALKARIEATQAAGVPEELIADRDAAAAALEEKRALKERLTIRCSELNREVVNAEATIKNARRDLDTLECVCPACKQDLPADRVEATRKHYLDTIDREEQVLAVQSKALAEHVRLTEEAAEAVKPLQQAYDGLVRQVAEAESLAALRPTLEAQLQQEQITLARHEKAVADTAERIARISKESPPEADLEPLYAELQQLADKVPVLEAQKAEKERLLEVYKWFNDTVLSAGGLKAYVFDAMLEKLNGLVRKYAERLGIDIRFGVDMTKANKPFTTEIRKRGVVAMYEELSGGEKQRCDICLAFALHDLVSGLNPTNILILDEVLEGIDSEGGTEEVFDLIRSKAGADRAVFVITHQLGVDAQYAREMVLSNETTTEVA